MIIVEDVPLELKGTEGIVRNEIPEAEVIGTAANEASFWRLIKQQQPDLVLLDLGLGGSTTVGVEICRQTKEAYPQVKILIFTGEILNEKLWVDVLDAGADGVILKSGELLTRRDVMAVMEGKQLSASSMQSAPSWLVRKPSSTTKSTSTTNVSCAISLSVIPRSRLRVFVACPLA